MSDEKIAANAYDPRTLEANEATANDYMQSKPLYLTSLPNIGFFPVPRYGHGNYQDYVTDPSTGKEVVMGRMFTK